MEDKLSQSVIEEFLGRSTPRHKECRPPKEAYYFFAKGRDLIEWDEKIPKKTMRRVFQGAIEYNEFEKGVLREFEMELLKYNQKTANSFVFPDNWKEADTLRFIQGSSYNIPKAIENLENHFLWRKETLPIQISDKIMEILNLGFIYGHGRDTNYRPNFILNARVFNQYLAKYSVEDWIFSLVYFIEYMIENMCIPGQVENWNIILDVSNFSMIFIPAQLKTIFYVLMNNYRCRLFVMYIVNVSPVLNFLWNTIKGVLDSNTEKKIKLLKNEDMNQIFTFINAEQIEERFGGKAPNVERHYFPPIMPSNRYSIESNPNDKLIPLNEYIELIKTNSNYSQSPFIEVNGGTVLNRSDGSINEEGNISLNQASRYEDAKSRSVNFRMNLNRSTKTIKTVYEDCEEKLGDIKRNFKGNEVEFDLDKEKEKDKNCFILERGSIKTNNGRNDETSKTRDGRSAKKKVSFIRLENEMSRNSCCSVNGSCLII